MGALRREAGGGMRENLLPASDVQPPPSDLRPPISEAKAAIDVHQGWFAPSKRPDPLASGQGRSREEDAVFAQALSTLSKQERRVLRLRARGLTIGEICEQCFLGDSTVKAHLHRAFQKLDLGGLRDRGRCARAAYLLGRHDARMEERTVTP